MAVTLKVIGNGHFQGAETNLADYSITEDATPINAADSSGGTGEASFTVSEDSGADGSILLRGDTVELEDGSMGRTRGLVSGVSGNDGEVQITASSRLNSLVIECDMPPVSGTLDAAFRYYLGVGSITSGIVIDPSVGSRIVALPAWSGNLWDHIKQLCAAEQVEVSLVSSNIVLRPVRGRIVETVKNTAESWSVTDGELAQYVAVNYYTNSYKTQAVLYPNTASGSDASVVQVGPGDVSVTSVTTTASIQGVQQPSPVDYVPEYYSGTSSVYSVVDAEGAPVLAADWVRAGGSVTVEVGADFRTLIITVVGPNISEGGPFKIAGMNGEAYSSLRIVGDGVVSTVNTLTLPTGAPASRAAQSLGVTVTNPFISSLAQAYSCGLQVAGMYAGAKQTISVSATTLNRKNEVGSVRYPTFAEFDALWAGKTFAQFDAAYAGKTYADFTAEYFAKVADSFDNQAFGNVAGARVQFRQAWYRIRSSTINYGIISYSAERDTLFSDFNTVWSGATFADYNTRMAGKTFEDFGVIPLWR